MYYHCYYFHNYCILILVYLYYYTYSSIGFCHKIKEQRLTIAKNAHNVANFLTNLVILQNYFQNWSFLKNKLVKKFYKNKNKFNVTHNFCCGNSRNLGRSCNMRGRGGEGWTGSSYELDAAQSIQSKFFSLFFTFQAAS